MSYQVLARKWRPAKFAELVGQAHVKSALINGLSNQRLHHAYLFTGTRGVGKTSIARIFAKSLNCETGVSAEPCGQCDTCLDVDAGRFVDLIEIDAASRTKVGDTREILDNVQYAPTRGRYKIYLIDEVHMLSRHSFNALLKTLEEPPEHVKFLLATTDPQKLPVTILSRCLQFNLQALSAEQIVNQLETILETEKIPFEAKAIALLAKFAKGSMRDALSLTDQAIAQSGQDITLANVQAMMGTVDIAWSQNLFAAVLKSDGEGLIKTFERLAQQSPDVEKVLDDMLSLCHQVALTQVLPSAAKLNEDNKAFIERVASQLRPEDVQVYYQLLLQGKKDIHLATDLTSGFEMVCLRLLAFKPADQFSVSAPEVKKNSSVAETGLDSATDLSNSGDDTGEPVANTPEKGMDPAGHEAYLEAPVLEPASQSNTLTPTLSDLGDVAQDEPLSDQLPPIKEASLDDTSMVETPVAEVASNESETTQEVVTELPIQDEQALLAQQAFYQEMAESQGFDPTETHDTDTAFEQYGPADYFDAPAATIESPERQATNEVLPQHGIQTGSELDNPVLAILASRGIDPAETPSFSTPVVEEDEPSSERLEDASVSEPTEPEPEIALKPIEHEEVRFAHEVDQWAQLIERSNLAGLGRQLALNGSVEIKENKIELTVKQEFAHLLNEKSEQELIQVVSQLAPEAEFVINKREITEMAPSDIQKNINQNRQERAEQSIHQDPVVQSLLTEFDGKIVPESIVPL